MSRAAGILLSVTSLPSKYGIGCFSKSAYDFVDWLKEAGQTYWQILPVCPTSFGDSPYQSFSTFAGNPYFISLEALIDEVKAVPTAQGVVEIFFPGEIEDRNTEKRLREGIVLAEQTWQSLARLADETRSPLPTEGAPA